MTSFCGVLADGAAEHPDRPLFVFPETRWRGEEGHTYASLTAAAAAAADSISQCAGPGDRVLLMFPSGTAFWEAFFGCLAHGITAVPLNVPNLNRPSELLQGVCQDCSPSLLLVDEETADLLKRREDRHPCFRGLRVLTPQRWHNTNSVFHFVPSNARYPALLQYTSGSTSRPKGVCISHENLLANCTLIRDRMGLRVGEDRGVTWLPHYHDMGLVGSYLSTLFSRNSTWCLPPEEFALRPARWLQLISEHTASICGGPDFAYRTCAEKITDEQLSNVDLSSWRVAYIGAERIQSQTLTRFEERFRKFGFRKTAFFACYGLGESTLMVTGGPANAVPAVRTVSAAALLKHSIASAAGEADSAIICGSGQTFPGLQVLIRDEKTGRLFPDNVIGEVIVAGDSVTTGYYNRPELNDDLFCEIGVDGKSQKFLRTGDLGFLANGELFITGRARELMIVRGRNLYPEDVETCVYDSHEALMPGGAVAFSADFSGEESLIVAAELQRSAVHRESPNEVFAATRQRVVEVFGVNPAAILLLRPASLPRTSSGKPRRLIVRESYIDGTIRCLFREEECPPGQAWSAKS